MRVLIAEDSSTFLDRISRYLAETPDVQVVGTAGDGVAALEAIGRLQPDLVLLDIHMPVRDGLFVLAHAKEQYPLTTFVVLTADDSALTRRRCLALGAQSVVRKAEVGVALPPLLAALRADLTAGRTV